LIEIKRHNCARILSPSRKKPYAPAAGRLAAAISAISARRRRSRDGAERSNEDSERIEAGSLHATRGKRPQNQCRERKMALP
jgi:hypothetical protein